MTSASSPCSTRCSRRRAPLSAGAGDHAANGQSGHARRNPKCRRDGQRPGLCGRHRKLWQDPLSFDPSRFTAEAKAKRHRCAYMPFGAGPRTCIGATFAMVEGKAILATLLARARFELPQGEQPVPFARITLRPKDGLNLKVTIL